MRRWLVILVLVLGLPARAAQTDRVTAFVDESMRGAFQELVSTFERETIHRVSPTFASTGALVQLIENGTHADLVLLAGQDAVERLNKRGLFHQSTLVPLVGPPAGRTTAGVFHLAIMATRERTITRVLYDFLRSARAGEAYRRHGFQTN
ncbi:MAG: hypothetical protein FJX35_17165 [Alphaproteobacteria bacterium]|nr:hypothetical protein [Alphaproteobacteria bacterium]